MKYAFVSDIHANIQAWKKVYEDIQANEVDRVISLGDVVGYGPNPREIIKEINTKVDAFVLGNHDAAVCGKIEKSLFNDEARLVLDWTSKQLKDEDRQFLGTFPLTLLGDGFRCAHGEFTNPANFDYVLDAEGALASWKAVPENLLIVGHTHEPALYVLGNSGTPRSVEPQDFVMDPGKRYFVNIGSVGHPRGTDLRSCYCIFDSEKKSLYWRRIGFDLDAYRKSLKATGLTLDPSYYLKPEPRKIPAAPATQRIVFTPPKTPDKAAHDVVREKDIKVLPRRPQKMPLNLKLILAAIVLIIGLYVWRAVPHSTEIDGAAGNPIPYSSGNLLRFPVSVIKPGKTLPGWTIHLEDKLRQGVGLNLNSMNAPFLYIRSKNAKHALEMVSSRIVAEPGQTWTFESDTEPRGLAGKVTISLVLTPAGSSSGKVIYKRDVGATLFSGPSKVQSRFTIPQPGGTLHVRIHGNFSGTLIFPSLSLKADAGQTAEPRATSVPDAPREVVAEPGEVSAPVQPSGGNDPWIMPPKK
jgi:predicted phosphodiesterase